MNTKILITTAILVLVFLIAVIFLYNMRVKNQSVTWKVDAVTVPCADDSYDRCLSVQQNGQTAYEPFSGTIEGFTFEPGYQYDLLIREEKTDTTSTYTLVEIQNQTEVPYLLITSPKDGEPIENLSSVQISGEGRGLFENSLVVEIIDASGKTLAKQPATLQTDEMGQTGTWTTSVRLFSKDDTSITMKAYATSPADGSTIAQYVLFTTVGSNDLIQKGKQAVQSLLPKIGQSVVNTVTETIAPEKAQSDLEAGVWNLTEYRSQDTMEKTTVIVPTAKFSSGTVSGFSGCNNYSGSYTTEGDSITFGPFATTRMMCDESAMNIESVYLLNLGKAQTYKIDTNVLELSGQDGVLLRYDQ